MGGYVYLSFFGWMHRFERDVCVGLCRYSLGVNRGEGIVGCVGIVWV